MYVIQSHISPIILYFVLCLLFHKIAKEFKEIFIQQI